MAQLVKNLSDNSEDTRDAGFDPWARRSPGEGNGNPLQYSCPGKFYGQSGLEGYSPWGCKESDMDEHTP